MIIVKVGDKKVKIPESYSEITIKEFTQIWKILHKYETIPLAEGEEYNDTQKLKMENNERDVTFMLVSHLLGLTKEETKQVDFLAAQEIVNVFNNFINNQPINKIIKKTGNNHFVFKGEAYYYPKPDFKDMTFGEYCELQQLQSTFGKETKNRFDFIAKQIALSCRRKGEEKDSYDLDERTKMFEDLTMDYVLAYSFFLSNRVKILGKNIQTSLKNQQTDSTEKQDTSLKDMVGSIPFMNLQEREFFQKEQNTMQ
ncbi:MAG: hypothetical protein Unbinned2716contig1000_18 [Prokaryotic dsDNA virus sp.]|nr:MAG: hypothetical protein Unbinned2716contig1000_18 [Prokaryotic dsDNA virus sp.]|tara:strand:+ start:20534 stop:21298 length:765 start_codon:yes stop_codon:yes gene_type:complete